MTERAKQRSAFCTRRGLYYGVYVSVILDDIVIYARTQAELLERIHTVLLCLRDVGLKV